MKPYIARLTVSKIQYIWANDLNRVTMQIAFDT